MALCPMNAPQEKSVLDVVMGKKDAAIWAVLSGFIVY